MKIYIKDIEEEDIKKFNEYIGTDKSYDLGYRQFTIKNKNVYLYYISGLSSAESVTYIMQTLLSLNDEQNKNVTIENIKDYIPHQQVEIVKEYTDAQDKIFSGQAIIFVETLDYAICIDTREYPGRTPQEPDTEKVVRGSRDGYTENIIINSALTRRRIKDKKLRIELYNVGVNTKTDVLLMYIEDKCNPNVVREAQEVLSNVQIEDLIMSEKVLEEVMFKQGINPYPKVRYTERPDIVSKHLYQGFIAIFVDTSPSVILAPITFFDHISHAEEYRQVSTVGTLLRVSRFLGVFTSLLLVPVWYLFAANPELLPDSLSYIGPKEDGNIPLIVQLLIGEIGLEFLRMAAVHTPSSLANAMGIIAGILVGQIAIDVGLFSPEVVLYIAISGVGSYATPSYELGLANKISKLVFLMAVYFFGIYGLIISFGLWFLLLASVKVYDKRYMYPILPFSLKGIINLIYRKPYKEKKINKRNKQT